MYSARLRQSQQHWHPDETKVLLATYPRVLQKLLSRGEGTEDLWQEVAKEVLESPAGGYWDEQEVGAGTSSIYSLRYKSFISHSLIFAFVDIHHTFFCRLQYIWA